MALDPALLELMVHTITLSPKTADNGYGESTYGTPQNIRAKISYKQRHRYGEGGVLIVEDGYVILAEVVDATPEWKLELPTPGGSRVVKITGVDQFTDEEGWHHTTVRFGPF